jgi:mannose-6-phosphate isomerase-like protein (cupin superfamily)
MPVFKSGKGQAPGWCELESFEIIELGSGDTHVFERRSEKEKLIVGNGVCQLRFDGQVVDAEEKTTVELVGAEGQFEVTKVTETTTLIRMCGRWGDELGGLGIFRAGPDDQRKGGGDPVDYEKETSFDNHYHDCDEYWIFFEGRGVAVSEGKQYEVGPGDCLATGMGWHHDFAKVFEPVKAVYFETTMEGEKRRGHLWNYTHGEAQPQKNRV